MDRFSCCFESVDLGVGLFDCFCQGETILYESVEEKLLVTLCLPVPSAYRLDCFGGVGFKLTFECACLVDVCFSEELAEEEETDFVVKLKVD